METGEHPQLLACNVVTATDLTPAGKSAHGHVKCVGSGFKFSIINGELRDALGVPATTARGSLENLGGKPLDLPPTQLLGHHGTLALLELQESLKDEQRDNSHALSSTGEPALWW